MQCNSLSVKTASHKDTSATEMKSWAVLLLAFLYPNKGFCEASLQLLKIQATANKKKQNLYWSRSRQPKKIG